MFHCFTANSILLGGLDRLCTTGNPPDKCPLNLKPVTSQTTEAKTLVQDTPTVIKTDRIVKNSHRMKMTSAKVPQTSDHFHSKVSMS